MRAAIYARYSSAQQREESIEAQLRACTDYILNQPGWVLTGQYIDRAFSARSDQRPEFQKMIEDAKHKKFDVLVIHKFEEFKKEAQNLSELHVYGFVFTTGNGQIELQFIADATNNPLYGSSILLINNRN